ncbi:MAG: hypothetical protein D6712_21055 [Chloroflexi bacterium]|nr:MAG: hypothetical protein D6712_21055 [Chloroflexota bacterium]
MLNEIRDEIQKHLAGGLVDWFEYDGVASGYYPNGVHLRMCQLQGRIVELRGLDGVSLPLVGDWQSLIPSVIDVTGGNLPHIPRAANGLFVALEDGLATVPHVSKNFTMPHLYPAIAARNGAVLKVGSVVLAHTSHSGVVCDHAIAHGFNFNDDPTSSYLVTAATRKVDAELLRDMLISRARTVQKTLHEQHHILFVYEASFDDADEMDKPLFSVTQNRVIEAGEAKGDGEVDALLLRDYLARLNFNRIFYSRDHVVIACNAGFAVLTRQYK